VAGPAGAAGSGAAGMRPPRSLGSWPTGLEEELVTSIVAIVRREIDQWLDSELEPLVRRRVQESLPRSE